MKYKLLLNDTKTLPTGEILYRIQALKNFNGVSKGEKGGYIAKEYNLSQLGNAQVFGNAWVYDDAQVYGNASEKQKELTPQEKVLAKIKLLDTRFAERQKQKKGA